jgi:hypothetical protein
MIRNQSGLTDLSGFKNKLWISAFVWHTRIVKGKQPSFALKIARGAGVGTALFRLGRVLPRFPTAGAAEHESSGNLPKIIWMYWHNGEHAAPDLARHCINSWRRHNPDWDVRMLDATNASDYVNVDYLPAGTRLQLVADAIRLELLDRYGGVWADASCLCTGPLDDWLIDRLGQGFFAFERPGPDRPLGNWFLASRQGGTLIASWAEVSRLYWKNGFYSNHIGPDGRRDQFVYHYLFEWMVNSDPQLRSEWLAVPRLPAGPPHLLQQQLRKCDQSSARFSALTPMRARVRASGQLSARPLDQAANQRLITETLSRTDVRVHKLDWRLENALEILRITAGGERSGDHRDVP